MKTILFIAITVFTNYYYSQSSTKCITSNKYKTMSNGKMHDTKGTAVACFNGNYFSFKTESNDLITFEIETHTRKTYTNGGKLVDQFMNVESKIYRRGFFSVDISHGAEIEVTINYPYVPNGYAIYFANKAWFGGQDASMYIIPIDSKIKKIKEDTPAIKKETAIQVQKEEPKEIIYTVVKEMPEFPGGTINMMKYIQKNIQYPQSAKDAGLTGKCFLKFVIDTIGAIRDIQILKGVPGCIECDEEAIRLLKSMPKWNPGKQDGKRVPVYYTYPINFQSKQ
jgi:TonB family protein